MKTLVCPCGVVRIGVPRRQKHCSNDCPHAKAARRAQLDAARAIRHRQALSAVRYKSSLEAFKAGYGMGWQKGRRKGFEAGYEQALKDWRQAMKESA